MIRSFPVLFSMSWIGLGSFSVSHSSDPSNGIIVLLSSCAPEWDLNVFTEPEVFFIHFHKKTFCVMQFATKEFASKEWLMGNPAAAVRFSVEWINWHLCVWIGPFISSHLVFCRKAVCYRWKWWNSVALLSGNLRSSNESMDPWTESQFLSSQFGSCWIKWAIICYWRVFRQEFPQFHGSPQW